MQRVQYTTLMTNMGGNWSDSIKLRTRGKVKHDLKY